MDDRRPLTKSQQRVWECLQACGNCAAEAARKLGVSNSTVRTHIHRIRAKGYEVETLEAGYTGPGRDIKVLSPPPEVDFPELEDPVDPKALWAERKTKYARKAAHEEATKLIPVTIKDPGPTGILFFGDPHVDDNGTDLAQLEAHTELVNKTPGLYAANVGDTTNAWVGRLARLYAEQSTSAEEAWALAEHWLRMCKKWLFLVAGNHDMWAGAGDPIKWIRGRVHYGPSSVRIEVRLWSGRGQVPDAHRFRINARHDFVGSSQWNPAHGSMKAAQMGFRDHLLINGHRHKSGYGILKNPANGEVSHCVQVASYKVYDRYAQEKGFLDQHLSPCAVAILDPYARREVSRVHVLFDPEAGADYLTWARKRAAK